MATVTLDLPGESDVIQTTQDCSLHCFRAREMYRHNLEPTAKSSGCEQAASCREQLTQIKSFLFQLAGGLRPRSIFIGAKQFTFNAPDKELLEQMKYELECECGDKMLAKRQNCQPKCPAPNCGARCGCGGCCGNSRTVRGYL